MTTGSTATVHMGTFNDAVITAAHLDLAHQGWGTILETMNPQSAYTPTDYGNTSDSDITKTPLTDTLTFHYSYEVVFTL